MLNKKASMSLPIVVLVFFVLLVFSAALFSFVKSSEKIEARVYDASVLESLNVHEKIVEFYIKKIGEDSLVGLDKGDANFENLFKENFKKGFESCDFEEDYLKGLQGNVSEGKFSVDLKEDFLVVKLNSLRFVGYKGNIGVKSFSKIETEFKLK